MCHVTTILPLHEQKPAECKHFYPPGHPHEYGCEYNHPNVLFKKTCNPTCPRYEKP